MQKVPSHINSRGSSLIEILIALSVFMVFVVATICATTTVARNARHVANSERAAFLAEASFEIIRNLRDAQYDFVNLPDGTYGLANLANVWALSGSFDVQGIFSRTVTLSTVNSDQKRIHTVVSWEDQVLGIHTVAMDTYLTNWRAPLNIGLTVNKTVVNHGGTKVLGDFLPNSLQTLAWDNSVEPPVQNTVNIPIVYSPFTMTLGPGVYTFLTTIDPNYALTLSADCLGNSIMLANGDTKLCTITYEEYVIPTVTTPTAALITETTATLGANVTSLGIPASIGERGICWGTTPAPTTNCVAEGGTTLGIFTQARTGFTAATTYYYRGYAINTTGTGYSADGTFTTGAATCVVASAPVGIPTVYDSASSASAVVTKPTGVAAGDILFAHILHNPAANIDRLSVIPAGWNLVGRHRNGNYNQALYYKIAGAAEGANYTFGFSAASKIAVTLSAYRGCFDVLNPISVFSNTKYVVSNATYRAASMTIPTANTTVLVFASMYTTTVRTFANPLTQGGGWTEDYDRGANTSDFSRASYRRFIVAPGVTGVIDSIGTSGSTVKHVFSVGLTPL